MLSFVDRLYAFVPNDDANKSTKALKRIVLATGGDDFITLLSIFAQTSALAPPALRTYYLSALAL